MALLVDLFRSLAATSIQPYPKWRDAITDGLDRVVLKSTTLPRELLAAARPTP